ncbi:MAG TPA: PepSY-associated TM helix domain-containing protein [Steroidobacteraceae bacterium]|nr:PepSY-associated TM helix domain-containing protein [Steroidobacteraceae bacterium]
MSTVSLETAVALRRMRVHRLIRKLHLWIGAWGAIAAVLFGTTGFLQNHRGVMKLPQGDSTEVSRVELPVPEEARASPEALRQWFHDTQHLDLESQRGPQGRPSERSPGDAPRAGDASSRRAARWTLSAGDTRKTTQAEYTQGADTLTLRTTVQSPLAILTRLHKGVGGGIGWVLLSDSFAVGLVALGLSGLTMWSRGRTPRQMIFSIAGAASLITALIAASAIL